MDWREVKDLIENEIDRAWLEEPPEMKKMRHGIATSGAGSFNQYFSTMVFSNVYFITVGQHMFYFLVECCDEDSISLEVLKTLTINSVVKGFQSTLFLAHCSTHKVHDLALKLIDVLPQISTKKEYRELIGAYTRYINLLQYWAHVTFPWHLGILYQYKKPEAVEEFYKLLHS